MSGRTSGMVFQKSRADTESDIGVSKSMRMTYSKEGAMFTSGRELKTEAQKLDSSEEKRPQTNRGSLYSRS